MSMTWFEQRILSDFDVETTVNLPAGKYVPFAEMKIPAKQVRRFGSSAIINGVDDRGELKLEIKDSSENVITGTARLRVSDANKITNRFLKGYRSEQLSAGVKLGSQPIGASQDAFLIIEFQADTTSTADRSQCSASVPITITAL